MIAIFTKFDDLITQVFKRRRTDKENRQVALCSLETRFELPLQGYKFPPRAYLRLESMFSQVIIFSGRVWNPWLHWCPEMQDNNSKHQDQVKELTEKTADSLDDLALKMLFISIQGNNLELYISYAIK